MKSRKSCDRALCAFAIATITFSLAVCSQAQTENTIFTFNGTNQGGYPNGNLLLDSAGNLYGASGQGGQKSRNCAISTGCGLIYKLSPGSSGSWTQTVLFDFDSATGIEVGPLIFDGAGNLFGVASSGGIGCTVDTFGCGLVFKLSPNSNGTWTQTVLYSFTGGTDGGFPTGQLAIDAVGNLYGTTIYGGMTTSNCSFGCGVVFELSPSSSGSWTETLLHTFTGGNDGTHGAGGPVVDAAGRVYGATIEGGIYPQCSTGTNCGVLFRLSQVSGVWKYRVLHTFTGGRDGGAPNGALLMDSAGNLYGTTEFGGNLSICSGNLGCGVIFKFSSQPDGTWKETSFAPDLWDGQQIAAGLVIDSAGNLYGAAVTGGPQTTCTSSSGCGLVYKLTPNSSGNWNVSILYRFKGSSDGGNPFYAPVLDSAGNLYGTAVNYGTNNYGVIYKITP